MAYLATTGEAWSSTGERVHFDSLLTRGGLAPEGFELRRFDQVADRFPDADLVVILAEELGPADPAGTARMQPFFEAWSDRRGREVTFATVANSTEAARRYEEQATRLDAWLAEYDRIDLYLGGVDSVADSLAWIGSLHGHQLPDAVQVHVFREDVIGTVTDAVLPLNAAVSEELTREHTRSRILRWELLEAGALAEVQPELRDIRDDVTACAAFLQRNEAPLRALGRVDDAAVPDAHRHTRMLWHAVELAEHLVTVERREEEAAWCIILAITELAPAAWLESRLQPHVRVEDAIVSFARTQEIDLQAQGNAIIGLLGDSVYDGPMADAARILAYLGTKPRDTGRYGLGHAMEAGPALLLWLALREGLRPQRNRLAHHFHDLNEHTLVHDVLHPAARRAATHARHLLNTHRTSDRDTASSTWVDRLVEPSDFALPSRPSTRGAQRLWTDLKESRPFDAFDASEVMRRMLSVARDPRHLELAVAAAAALRADGYGDRLDEELKSVRTRLENQHRALAISDNDADQLEALLHDECLLVARLEDERRSPLRDVLDWFVPNGRQREHPLIGVRADLLKRLETGAVDTGGGR